MKFIKDLAYTIVYLLKLISAFMRGEKRYPYEKRHSGTLTLLANAPSLKEVLPRVLTDEEFKNTDFVVLNYFATCDEFTKIKPTHYCFADPMFFQRNHRYEDVMKLFATLKEKVDWDMNVYVPSYFYKRFLLFSRLDENKFLRIIPVMEVEYKGFECFRTWLYKHNLASPKNSTVAILAIYTGLNNGYDRINLYGVDMTFFDNLCVNEHNQLCSIYRHFNDDEEELKPILRNDTDQVFKVAEYVFSVGSMFESHDILSKYADKLAVSVNNYTRCSLIDSYARISSRENR